MISYRKSSLIHTFWAACLIVILTALVSGCVKGEAHVTVNSDGSADLALKASVPEELWEEMDETALIGKLDASLHKSGFQTETTDNGSDKEWMGRRRIKRSEWVNAAGKTNFLKKINGADFTYNTHQGWFFTTYRLEGAADPSKMMPAKANLLTDRLNSLSPFVRKLVLSQLKLDLAVTLPFPPKSSNADTTADGGRTLIWHVSFSGSNPFRLEVLAPNLRHMFYAAGLAVIALIILYTVHRRRRNRQA